MHTRRDDPALPARVRTRRTATTSSTCRPGRPRARAQGRAAAVHAGSFARGAAPAAGRARPPRRRARALLDERAGLGRGRAPALGVPVRADLPRARLGQAPPPGRRRHQPGRPDRARAAAVPRRRPRGRHLLRRGRRAAPRSGCPRDRVVDRAVRGRHRRCSRPRGPVAPRSAPAAAAGARPAGRAQGRQDDVDPGAAAVPDAELRRRRRPGAGRAGHRPGGRGGCAALAARAGVGRPGRRSPGRCARAGRARPDPLGRRRRWPCPGTSRSASRRWRRWRAARRWSRPRSAGCSTPCVDGVTGDLVPPRDPERPGARCSPRCSPTTSAGAALRRRRRARAARAATGGPRRRATPRRSTAEVHRRAARRRGGRPMSAPPHRFFENDAAEVPHPTPART